MKVNTKTVKLCMKLYWKLFQLASLLLIEHIIMTDSLARRNIAIAINLQRYWRSLYRMGAIESDAKYCEGRNVCSEFIEACYDYIENN